MSNSNHDVAKIKPTPVPAKASSSPPEVQIEFIRSCFERIAALREQLGPPSSENFGRYLNLAHQRTYPDEAAQAAKKLFRKRLPFTEGDLSFLVGRLAYLECVTIHAVPLVSDLVSALERHTEKSPPGPQLKESMNCLQQALDKTSNAPEQKLRQRIIAMINAPSSRVGDVPRVMLHP